MPAVAVILREKNHIARSTIVLIWVKENSHYFSLPVSGKCREHYSSKPISNKLTLQFLHLLCWVVLILSWPTLQVAFLFLLARLASSPGVWVSGRQCEQERQGGGGGRENTSVCVSDLWNIPECNSYPSSFELATGRWYVFDKFFNLQIQCPLPWLQQQI